MTANKSASIVKGIEKHMKQVAKDRDKIDEFIQTLEQLREDCQDAFDSLTDARDALSRLV